MTAATVEPSGDPGATRHPSYGEERDRRRRVRRERANAAAKTRIDPKKLPDPLLPDDARRRSAMTLMVLAFAGSAALHGAAAVASFLARAAGRGHDNTYTQAVEMRFVEPPKPVPPPQAVTAPEEPIVPMPPPAPLPRVVPVVQKPVATEKPLPPPDPVDLQAPPPKDPPKEPPRRVVGISMESTTAGGEGEAFAAGNTRMGKTEEVAEDPTRVEHLAPAFVAPRRTTAPTPAYPPALRAGGVEGDVGLRVEIDATGHVTQVTVAHPSGHAEFDSAATDAANRSAYEPARVNGVAVARAIEFTVRFRLHP